MEVRLLPEKQPVPKLITELGIVMEVKLLQSEKQWSPTLVTELGMAMEVKLLQPEKQEAPRLVTEFGINVFLHPANNLLVEVSMIALQFSLESYTGLAVSTVICSRLLQPAKQLSPKRVTE